MEVWFVTIKFTSGIKVQSFFVRHFVSLISFLHPVLLFFFILFTGQDRPRALWIAQNVKERVDVVDAGLCSKGHKRLADDRHTCNNHGASA